MCILLHEYVRACVTSIGNNNIPVQLYPRPMGVFTGVNIWAPLHWLLFIIPNNRYTFDIGAEYQTFEKLVTFWYFTLTQIYLFIPLLLNSKNTYGRPNWKQINLTLPACIFTNYLIFYSVYHFTRINESTPKKTFSFINSFKNCIVLWATIIRLTLQSIFLHPY